MVIKSSLKRRSIMKDKIFNLIGDIDTQLQAGAKNPDTLFSFGLILLKYNRPGFAKAFLQHAAKFNHIVAEQHLLILDDRKLPVVVRIETILNNY
jgi:hypothetical protein